MLDFATSGPEYANAVTSARQIESERRRWARELDELKQSPRGNERTGLFGPSPTERRRRALERALDAAQAEGITVDEWFRMQRIDPALYDRAVWAGLADEPTRGGKQAA